MPTWIEADSLVNLRDVGGIRTTDGGRIADGRLLRSDNLQDLTDDDIAMLLARGLTDVVDLRTIVEVRNEGPGPLARGGQVSIHHHSLFIEDEQHPPESSAGQGPEPISVALDTDGQPGEPSEPATPDHRRAVPQDALPWVGLAPSASHDNVSSSYYLSYLIDRPDSVLAALRVIAEADGATLVHCAAGKDRTGTIVALALLAVGAEPEDVIADYAASSERMQAIVDRLAASPTYADNLRGRPLSSHLTQPDTMRGVIDGIQRDYGGIGPALASIGWTDQDTAALRAKLLG